MRRGSNPPAKFSHPGSSTNTNPHTHRFIRLLHRTPFSTQNFEPPHISNHTAHTHTHSPLFRIILFASAVQILTIHPSHVPDRPLSV